LNKKALKWPVIVAGFLLGALALVIAGAIAYINYEGPRTEGQEKSLKIIREIRNQSPQPNAFSGEFPNQAPEIYDDRLRPGGYSASDGGA